MRLNIIKTIIAVALSALLAYCIYVWDKSGNGLLLPLGCLAANMILLVSALGIEIKGIRSMVNFKITAWIFFILEFILNVVLCHIDYSTPTFIISNGIILILFILIAYSIGNTKYQ